MARAAQLVVLVLLAGGALPGCGDDDEPATPALEVFAATSLDQPLSSCAGDVPGVRVEVTTGATGDLADKIRSGFRPDVFAAADTARPAALQRERLLGRPVPFATNELILAVPKGSEIRALEDLDGSDRLVVGSPAVSVGRYTEQVLRRLSAARRARLRASVVRETQDVQGIVRSLLEGSADAGFTYRTDVIATGGALEAVPLAGDLRPTVTYAAGVVGGTDQPDVAERYVNGLRDGPCALALRDAGFGPPPPGSA